MIRNLYVAFCRKFGIKYAIRVGDQVRFCGGPGEVQPVQIGALVKVLSITDYGGYFVTTGRNGLDYCFFAKREELE